VRDHSSFSSMRVMKVLMRSPFTLFERFALARLSPLCETFGR
jgi:hypothetical protein